MNQQDETKRMPPQSPDLDVHRRDLLRLTGAGVAALGVTSILNIPFAKAQDMSNGADNFYTSDRVTCRRSPSKANIE